MYLEKKCKDSNQAQNRPSYLAFVFVLIFGDLWADVCDVEGGFVSNWPAKVQSKGSVSDFSVKWAKDFGSVWFVKGHFLPEFPLV